MGRFPSNQNSPLKNMMGRFSANPNERKTSNTKEGRHNYYLANREKRLSYAADYYAKNSSLINHKLREKRAAETDKINAQKDLVQSGVAASKKRSAPQQPSSRSKRKKTIPEQNNNPLISSLNINEQLQDKPLEEEYSNSSVYPPQSIAFFKRFPLLNQEEYVSEQNNNYEGANLNNECLNLSEKDISEASDGLSIESMEAPKCLNNDKKNIYEALSVELSKNYQEDPITWDDVVETILGL